MMLVRSHPEPGREWHEQGPQALVIGIAIITKNIYTRSSQKIWTMQPHSKTFTWVSGNNIGLPRFWTSLLLSDKHNHRGYLERADLVWSMVQPSLP